MRVWDLHSGQIVRRFAEANATLGEVALSPDGRTVLGGSTDGTVTLWDVETGEEIRRFVDDQPITAVTFSPDGTKALIGAGYLLNEKVESGHIILWDVETGEEIRRFEGQPYAVEAVEFSPDGRLAVSLGMAPWRFSGMWKRGQKFGALRITGWTACGLLNPIGTYNLVPMVSRYSPRMQADRSSGGMWIAAQQIQQLVGHNLAAEGIVFSNDGQQLVSGGSDSLVILWDMQTGNILRRFC